MEEVSDLAQGTAFNPTRSCLRVAKTAWHQGLAQGFCGEPLRERAPPGPTKLGFSERPGQQSLSSCSFICSAAWLLAVRALWLLRVRTLGSLHNGGPPAATSRWKA